MRSSQPSSRGSRSTRAHILSAIAGVALAIVLSIVVFLGLEAWPAFQRVGARLLSDSAWLPSASADDGQFLITPMILGTVWATLGAVLIATPLGVLSAVFCCFYAPPFLARLYRQLLELLAAVPSVVFGFWGLMVLVPLLRLWQPPGASLLAGMLILAVMIVPGLALMVDASLRAVPKSQLDAAAALGFSRPAILRHVVFPFVRSNLRTAVLLQTGRALGETMAVLMVCGNIARSPESVWDPVRTLTVNIALEMGYAVGDHRSVLFASGLVLLLVGVLVVFAAAPWREGESVHA